MNEKGTNFCSFSVGQEPTTPAYAYEAVTQSTPPPNDRHLTLLNLSPCIKTLGIGKIPKLSPFMGSGTKKNSELHPLYLSI